MSSRCLVSMRRSISASVALAAVLSAGSAGAVCGDPTGDGHVKTNDALYTLRAGVSLVPCALATCDVDGDADIDTADALKILRNSTGLPPALACLALPDDALYDGQWGLPAIHAPAIWAERTDCSDVVVAVVDSGVDYFHDDLNQNMWRNPGEIPFNHKDDDGNGFADDVYGWDFVDKDEFPWDPLGHGTHVAGIIGAVGNTEGTVGVCWKASIMAVRFLDEDNGGFASDSLQAIDYARKNGAKVINNSWGGGHADSGEYFALKAASDEDIVLVMAAGNDGKDVDVNWDWPGHYMLINQINVAATSEAGELASFSNFGDHHVHVAAPGDGILSTLPKDEFGTLGGTSMAAPFVAGAAAMLRSEFPLLSALDVKRVLMDTVDVDDDYADEIISGGQIDLEAAFARAEFVQLHGSSALASASSEATVEAEPKVTGRKVTRTFTAEGKKFPNRQDAEETLNNGQTKKVTMAADHVLVLLADDANVGTLASQGFKILAKLRTDQPAVLVEAPDGVDAAIAALEGVDGVVSAEPDYYVIAR